jgi:hypothetical protein
MLTPSKREDSADGLAVSMPGLLEGRIEGQVLDPATRSGGYAGATTLGQRRTPFPPDAGAQATVGKDVFVSSSQVQAFC